ncbi:MAG: hypothetical protein PHD15_05275 [Clostridia bacterium]|nr:hypothetical protein [Clostridia bacterium]MDD4387146.1 hypothetical protein [Clostridia bacterium]
MKTNIKSGISLIILVIAIIIIIILASAIIISVVNNNPISQAKKMTFINDLRNFEDELNSYHSDQSIYVQKGYNSSSLQADENNITYNGIVDSNKTINDIILLLGSNSKYDGLFEVLDGKLVYKGTDENEKEWAEEIGIVTIIAASEMFVVNQPVLSAGMTAKKWNGSSWDTVSDPDNDTSWYDYENKEWANAQTEDESMWVWIPRYEYQIPTPHSLTAQTIAVNFLINTETTASTGYTVHPAFTFGSTELTGIWVAKFEASGTASAVDVKPGIASLRSITIDTMFTACRNMETINGARYGWGTSGTGIDTHLMKNTEWGAVAYLSSSAYGKTDEVWINPNSDYLTGQAGTSVSADPTTSTYSYDDLIYGINASTTGNIYGVYDMNGGSWEYTASYVANGHANLTTYGLSLVSAIGQYKDVYLQGSSDTRLLNYSANSDKKGDAVYETSTTDIGATSWYGDYSVMPSSSVPFLYRGGRASNSTGAGVFSFNDNSGTLQSFIGFRPVLVLSGAL